MTKPITIREDLKELDIEFLHGVPVRLGDKAIDLILNIVVERINKIGGVDIVKFERDKTGWIEEVGVDPDDMTDKDMVAVWRLANHFKEQALKDVKDLLMEGRR